MGCVVLEGALGNCSKPRSSWRPVSSAPPPPCSSSITILSLPLPDPQVSTWLQGLPYLSPLTPLSSDQATAVVLAPLTPWRSPWRGSWVCSCGGRDIREDGAGCWGGPKAQFKGPQFHTAARSPRKYLPPKGLAVRELVWVELGRF